MYLEHWTKKLYPTGLELEESKTHNSVTVLPWIGPGLASVSRQVSWVLLICQCHLFPRDQALHRVVELATG